MQLCAIKQPGSLLTSVPASVGWPPSTLSGKTEAELRASRESLCVTAGAEVFVPLLEEFFLYATEVAWPPS